MGHFDKGSVPLEGVSDEQMSLVHVALGENTKREEPWFVYKNYNCEGVDISGRRIIFLTREGKIRSKKVLRRRRSKCINPLSLFRY